jgi:hypothetical protein
MGVRGVCDGVGDGGVVSTTVGVGVSVDGVAEAVGEMLRVITGSVGVAPRRKTAAAIRERGAKNI